MNGEAHIFWRTTRLTLLAGAAAALTGCADLPRLEPGASAPVDPASPAAAAVNQAARTPGPWPTFADIPEIPADLRDAAGWRAAVQDQKAEGVYTTRAAAEETWTLRDSEAFAELARAEANLLDVHAPTDAEIAESEAYARALRQRATPPPPPR